MYTNRQWTKVFACFQFSIYIPYKTTIFRSLSWSQFIPDFDNFISIKTKFYAVLQYNFKIIFYDKHSENIQAKHTTELISFKIQYSTFVDKLFKSVFKSWRFEKHASKYYFKITTINYISFCFLCSVSS
jgi:hypothetical protein